MLQAGDTISHYRVLGELGRGGMGVVYKAEDTKLDRTVALKILPPSALVSADDRARFRREARAAAALNHANIGHVYEIDEVDSAGGETQPFIAMEYIDGETLSERIARGPLPLDQAIDTATKIASGLGAAHEKDIVHRDVKSGNVMLAKDGAVKILDFGLAKTAASTKLTQMGSTVGTAGYMSPEQARGDDVDHRTDVWSLGVILFEMVAGRLPFSADYEQAIVYGILNEDPEPLTALRTGVPMELERIVAKCLAKDRARRYQATADLIVDLEDVQTHGATVTRTATRSSALPVPPDDRGWHDDLASRSWASKPLIVSAAALAGLVIGALAWSLAFDGTVSGPAAALTTDLILPEGVSLESYRSAPLQLDRIALDIDRDGTNVVFAGTDGRSTVLYLRSLETGETRRLEETEGAYGPFFSPDGSWVGFFTGSRLKKISVSDGTLVDLAEASLPYGGSWGPNGRIVYSNNECQTLAVLDESSGAKNVVGLSGICIANPLHIGSGDWVLAASNDSRLVAIEISTGRYRDLGAETSSLALVDTNILILSREGQLLATRIDLETLELTDSVVEIQGGVLEPWGSPQYAVSRSGTLVFAPGPWLGMSRLSWLYRNGEVEAIPDFDPQVYGEFTLSPSADRIVVSIEERPLITLWVYEFERGNRIRLSSDGSSRFSVWTPDGREIVFARTLGNDSFVLKRLAEGVGDVDTLWTISAAPDWVTPDGQRVGFSSDGPNRQPDIFVADLEQDAPFEPITAEPTATEVLSRLSPDGRYVAYTSDQTGNYQVYVQRFPTTTERWQVSVGGGEEPVWSADSERLFYRVGNHLMQVAVSHDGDNPRFSVPDTIFAGQFSNVSGHSFDYDDANDRWLILRTKETRPKVTHLRVVSDIRARLEEGLRR